MKRRLSKAIELLLIIGFVTLEIVIGSSQNAPEWFGSPVYYGLVIAVLIIGFAFLWVWADTGEKTEIDELEERMEQLFLRQTQSIDKLTTEIRKERKLWNAKFKQ